VRFSWIPRAENSHADRLANEAMDAAARGEVWRVGGDSGPADAADAWLAEHEPTASLAPETPNRLHGWMDAAARPTTTLLVRHGQTPMSVDKRFSGIGDPELTEVGRARLRRPPPGWPARVRRCDQQSAVRARETGRLVPRRSVSRWPSSRVCGRPTSATGRATPSRR
jgi:hypothetical protein